MASVNKILIIGNLTRDPEVTYTQQGACVCKISVATSEKWNDKNTGEKREDTEFHRVVFFGKTGEVVGQHFTKGMPIYIEGKNKTSKYTKDGVDHYSTDVIANNFQFIGSKQDGVQQQQAPAQTGGFQNQAPAQTGGFQQQQKQQPAQQGGFKQNTGSFNNANNGNAGFHNQGNQGFQDKAEDD